MNQPLQVTFHNIQSSDAVREYVATKAAKLPTFYDQILSCKVALEEPHNHHQHGKHFRVRVLIAVPGQELVAGSAPRDNDPTYEDLYAAIDAAFADAGRQVHDYASRKRSVARRSSPPPKYTES